MQKNYKPISRENLLFKEMDDGGVIYEPALEKCHSLNATSAYIWSLCDGNYEIREIIEMIKNDFAEFTSAPEQAVEEIINKFEELNLLQK